MTQRHRNRQVHKQKQKYKILKKTAKQFLTQNVHTGHSPEIHGHLTLLVGHIFVHNDGRRGAKRVLTVLTSQQPFARRFSGFGSYRKKNERNH